MLLNLSLCVRLFHLSAFDAYEIEKGIWCASALSSGAKMIIALAIRFDVFVCGLCVFGLCRCAQPAACLMVMQNIN